jgi:hypothetical protein
VISLKKTADSENNMGKKSMDKSLIEVAWMKLIERESYLYEIRQKNSLVRKCLICGKDILLKTNYQKARVTCSINCRVKKFRKNNPTL